MPSRRAFTKIESFGDRERTDALTGHSDPSSTITTSRSNDAGDRFSTDVTVRRSVGSASLTSTMTIDVLGSPLEAGACGTSQPLPYLSLHAAGLTSGSGRESDNDAETCRLYWKRGSIGPGCFRVSGLFAVRTRTTSTSTGEDTKRSFAQLRPFNILSMQFWTQSVAPRRLERYASGRDRSISHMSAPALCGLAGGQ